ncbi:hypothetical protein Xinn_00571 [Xenorhabdus innexi]|uniref:Uncharacterized protein n=1 Tax=Xenorhabdus innexi TaxID=290109 RepID=A0A2G0NTK4_9GAMM|nr:hypothetical protein Xinn_00571 [Xenorhabdus innexi]
MMRIGVNNFKIDSIFIVRVLFLFFAFITGEYFLLVG